MCYEKARDVCFDHRFDGGIFGGGFTGGDIARKTWQAGW
jgi:hypothetical protein